MMLWNNSSSSIPSKGGWRRQIERSEQGRGRQSAVSNTHDRQMTENESSSQSLSLGPEQKHVHFRDPCTRLHSRRGRSGVLVPVQPASRRAAHRRTTSPLPCRRAGRPRSAAERDEGTERRRVASERRSGCYG